MQTQWTLRILFPHPKILLTSSGFWGSMHLSFSAFRTTFFWSGRGLRTFSTMASEMEACREKIDKSILNSQRDYAQLSDIHTWWKFPTKVPTEKSAKTKGASGIITPFKLARWAAPGAVDRCQDCLASQPMVHTFCFITERCLQQIASLALSWLPTKTHP